MQIKTTKRSTTKVKNHKMDRSLVSKQAWEVEYVRLNFYKKDGEAIIHPTAQTVKDLAKANNHSRQRLYAALRIQGFTQMRIR